jgi:hypothetical protein
MYPPRVFISYSHDSTYHKDWVLKFATILREKGVDVSLDQWDLQPGDDLPHFMEQHLDAADYVLMICSENYVKKANEGEGGVGYEKMIITSSLLSKISENKIIPIIRQNASSICPTFLKTKKYINFSVDSEFYYKIDELLRTLLKAPLRKKPEIGENPYNSNEEYQSVRNEGRLKNDFSGKSPEKNIQDYYYFEQLKKDVTNAQQLHELYKKFGDKFIDY